jgi:hypothetical protein
MGFYVCTTGTANVIEKVWGWGDFEASKEDDLEGKYEAAMGSMIKMLRLERPLAPSSQLHASIMIYQKATWLISAMCIRSSG